MGLILNHLSASDAQDYTDGQGRAYIGVSGSMYFAPEGHGGARPLGAEAQSLHGWSSHPDAAYIFSGSAGGNDKVAFLGDVVVSGSLTLGAGGSFLDNSSDFTAEEIPFAVDGNTLKSSDHLSFNEDGNASAIATQTSDFTDGVLSIGNAAGEDVAVKLSAGDLSLFTGIDAGGTTQRAGIHVGQDRVLSISGSGASSSPGKGKLAVEFGGLGDVQMGSGGIVGGSPVGGDFRINAASDMTGSAGGGVLISSTGGAGFGTIVSAANVLSLVSSKTGAGGVVVNANHGDNDIDLQIAGSSVLKVEDDQIIASQDVMVADSKTVNSAGDAAKTIFAAMNVDANALTLGGGATVAMGGSLKLATDGQIEDSNGDTRFTAANGADTLIAGDNGTTVLTVADDLVTSAQNINISDSGDASSATDANASLHTDGGISVTKSVHIGQKLTVDGDLEIKGQSTVIDTENLVVEDPLVVLGSSSGSFAAAGDRGFVFAQNAAPNGSPVMFWNNGGIVSGAPTGTFEFVLANASGSESSITPLGTNGSAHLDIQAGGAILKDIVLNKADAAGDVDIKFQSGGTTAFSMGIDDSDSNVWKLHSDTALADNSDVALSAAGVLTVASSVLTTTDINGGSIDGTNIGAASAGTGAFTTLGASGQSDLEGIVNLAATGVATTVKGTFNVDEAATFDTTVGVSGDLTLSGGDGALTFSGADASIKVPDNSAAALVIEEADNAYLTIVTTDDSESVTIHKKLLPSGDNSIDLGSNSARFANIYTGDLNLRNDRGDWTLIEEEDFISFRNNRSGRRFRMVMEDITGTGTYGPGNDGEM